MNILVSCLNTNGLGGSELYHYELARELALAGHDVTLFTLRPIVPTDIVRIKLADYVKQVDINTIDFDCYPDIIISSQPEPTRYIIDAYPNVPIISIIHSEIRSETPILDSNIKHYIGIRPSIVDMLINQYNIPSEKVSLIYNPIDTSRFYPKNEESRLHRITGIFIGEVLDPIRFKAVSHLVKSCVDQEYDLYIMSESRYDFGVPNVYYLDKRWDTEAVVDGMDFTAGILLGRTTLEGLCCNVPGFIYNINEHGDILSIDMVDPDEDIPECDSKVVASQIIELCNTIING